MKEKNLFLRIFRFIRFTSPVSNEDEVSQNAWLSKKRDDYFNSHRPQHVPLNYLTPAD